MDCVRGGNSGGLIGPGAVVRSARRGRLKCVVGVPLAAEPRLAPCEYGRSLSLPTFNQLEVQESLVELLLVFEVEARRSAI